MPADVSWTSATHYDGDGIGLPNQNQIFRLPITFSIIDQYNHNVERVYFVMVYATFTEYQISKIVFFQ